MTFHCQGKKTRNLLNVQPTLSRKINPEIRKCMHSRKSKNGTTFGAYSAVFSTSNWLFLFITITTWQKCFCCSQFLGFNSDANISKCHILESCIFIIHVSLWHFSIAVKCFCNYKQFFEIRLNFITSRWRVKLLKNWQPSLMTTSEENLSLFCL